MKNFPHSWLGPILIPHIGSLYPQAYLLPLQESPLIGSLAGTSLMSSPGTSGAHTFWWAAHSCSPLKLPPLPSYVIPSPQLSLHRKMPGCRLCPLGGSHSSGKRSRSPVQQQAGSSVGDGSEEGGRHCPGPIFYTQGQATWPLKGQWFGDILLKRI